MRTAPASPHHSKTVRLVPIPSCRTLAMRSTSDQDNPFLPLRCVGFLAPTLAAPPCQSCVTNPLPTAPHHSVRSQPCDSCHYDPLPADPSRRVALRFWPRLSSLTLPLRSLRC